MYLEDKTLLYCCLPTISNLKTVCSVLYNINFTTEANLV